MKTKDEGLGKWFLFKICEGKLEIKTKKKILISYINF